MSEQKKYCNILHFHPYGEQPPVVEDEDTGYIYVPDTYIGVFPIKEGEESEEADPNIMRLAGGDDYLGYDGYVVFIGDKPVYSIDRYSLDDDSSAILDMAEAIGNHLGMRVEHGEAAERGRYFRNEEHKRALEKAREEYERPMTERELSLARKFVRDYAGANLPDEKLNEVFREQKRDVARFYGNPSDGDSVIIKNMGGPMGSYREDLEHQLVKVLSEKLLPGVEQPVDNWEDERIRAYVSQLRELFEKEGWLDEKKFKELYEEFL